MEGAGRGRNSTSRAVDQVMVIVLMRRRPYTQLIEDRRLTPRRATMQR